MKINDTFIPGLKLIQLNKYNDSRGSFIKVFNEEYFAACGLDTNFRESYYSISGKNVIRGMHFQIPPSHHTKLVYLNRGRILDVVLDIRNSSETYGKFFTMELNARNPVLAYIPAGCAHGFLSLEDNSIVTYLQTTGYQPELDKGIRYNSFGMEWGIDNPVVSERDLSFPEFSQIDVIFL